MEVILADGERLLSGRIIPANESSIYGTEYIVSIIYGYRISASKFATGSM